MAAKTSRSWRGALATSRRLRNALVVLLVLVALYAAYRYTLHRMVEAKLDEIRKQGYPATLAELDKWYPTPPRGENVADVYLEAFKLFAPNQGSDTNLPGVSYNTKLPLRGQPMSEDMRALVVEYLERNKQALALLHQGAKLTQCRYPVDLTQGGGVLLTHLSGVRQGVRLLSLDALLHAELGEAAQAARSICSSLALARSLTAEPIYVSQLVRMTSYWIAAIHLEAVLNRVSLSDDSLTELAKRFSELDARNALVRGYAGDRCFEIDFSKHPVERILSMFGNDMPAPPTLKGRVLFFMASGRFDILVLHNLEAIERFLNVCRMPFPEGVKHAHDSDPPFPLAAFFVGGIWRLGDGRTTVQRAALNTAKVSASLAALAIERYRLANGRLPDKPDELVPAYLAALLTDPFDGQPLRYKKLAKGYVVYSVGEDGKDDGGDEKKDITFTVER